MNTKRDEKKVYGIGLLDIKQPLLTKRYRGKGRPRKKDYEYKTLVEMQREINNIMNQRLTREFFK